MSDYLASFKEDPNIKRDLASGAVVNTNIAAYEQHANTKKSKRNMEQRIQSLEVQLSELIQAFGSMKSKE